MAKLSFKGLNTKNLFHFINMRNLCLGLSALLIIYYLISFGFESPFDNIFGRYTPFRYGNKSGYSLPNFPDKFAVYTGLTACLIQIISSYFKKTNALKRLGNILSVILFLPISLYLLMFVGLLITFSFFTWVIYMVFRYIIGK